MWIPLLHLLLACAGAPPPASPPPTSPGGCLTCHADAPAPPHAEVPCQGCHGGDPTATEAPRAHAGLELEPGALDTVDRSCGACHPQEVERVRGSLMTTNAGIISVDRWAMTELPAPTGAEAMAELLAEPDPTPAQDHLRRLCAGCHLGTRRDNRDDAVGDGGSGCSACHLGPGAGGHPDIAGVPGDQRCYGCHSRSGRISLAYQGLAEVAGADLAACASPQALPDGRSACRVSPDLHAEAGLACVDCHLHTELMGDGVRHAHKEEQVEIRCESCHGPGAREQTWAEVEDAVSQTLLRLNGQTRAGDERVRLGARGTPVWNLRWDGAEWRLVGKRTAVDLAVPQTPADAAHALPGHGRLACSACHTAWAPRCTSCHTAYDPGLRQWDFGQGAEVPGAWVEHAASMGFGAPALGVSAEGRIVPAIPGMISTVDRGAGEILSRRLYAPAAPHTTARAGRACADCHLSPAAMGLGAGALGVGPDGPTFAPVADDGWVTLLAAAPSAGTRPGFRSLDRAEQLRVLRVGVCVKCHTDPGHAAHQDPARARGQVLEARGNCRLPAGDWLWLR